MIKKSLIKNLFLIISFVLLVSNVYSASMQAPSIGARATGMAGAFVAIADDPSAIYCNPAGMSFYNGTKLMVDTVFVDPHSFYETDRGGEEESITTVQMIPGTFFTRKLNDSFSIGVGDYTPFGLKQRWEDDASLKYNSTRSEIWLNNLQLALSCKPTENLGIGASFGKSFANLNAKLYTWVVGEGGISPSESYIKTHCEGEGLSGNIGFLWSVLDNWTIGGAWRSETQVKFKGEADINPYNPIDYDEFERDVSLDFIFPQTVALGVSYHGFEKLLISGQVDWVNWSKIDKLNEKFDSPITVLMPGISVDEMELIRNWKDTYIFRLGTEYKMTPKFTVRGGYMWDPSPVPAETLDPMMFDVSSNRYFVGASFPVWKMNVDVAYSYSQGIKREAKDSENIPRTNGDYWGYSHVLELSMTYTF